MVADERKCLCCSNCFMTRRGGSPRKFSPPARQRRKRRSFVSLPCSPLTLPGSRHLAGTQLTCSAATAPVHGTDRANSGKCWRGSWHDERPCKQSPERWCRPSPGARRMARHRDRRRKGLRCITIELRETEIDVLIRRGRLAPGSRGDLTAVRRALYGLLDDAGGDAQQRPSDASHIPRSSPHFRSPARLRPSRPSGY
jgi:hypothetical protein